MRRKQLNFTNEFLMLKGDKTMRFMMFMIPKVYQPDTPPGEKAGEGFAPPAESVARMMKFNEELAKDRRADLT